MTEISMDKKYQTRDGREVRILCTDGPDHRYPVCGFIGPLFMMWTEDGRVTEGDHGEHPDDLVEIPEEITIEGWMNVYDDHTGGHAIGTLNTSKDEADRVSGCEDRIACVPIKITFKKGEGLDG